MPDQTVLIVDDERDVRDSLALLLGVVGLRTATAADGRSALAYLRTHPAPALIVLDLRMPGMSGIQFRREQLSDDELAEIPVVVCSGEYRPEEAELGDVAAFFTKPADPMRLLDVVRRYCGPRS